MVPAEDRALVQIVDEALADAARRSGDWLVCHPGCHQCCIGVFPITQLDAQRLQAGLEQLAKQDPARTHAVRARIQQTLTTLGNNFPGDFAKGVLDVDAPAFEEFANDVICPVLDPSTGTCDLYASRPLTCRTFGPPVPDEAGGIGVCELCFVGAPVEAIQAALMDTSFYQAEAEMNRPLGEQPTLIALALRDR